MRESEEKVEKVNKKQNRKEDGPHAPRGKVKENVEFKVNCKPVLKNGNRQGDPQDAPRCGAKTRKGSPCMGPAMRNGRCRMHGGKSTGPRTPEGVERCRMANWKHGSYSETSPINKMLRVLRECRQIRRQIHLELNLK
jgi:hypothetical protein